MCDANAEMRVVSMLRRFNLDYADITNADMRMAHMRRLIDLWHYYWLPDYDYLHGLPDDVPF